MYINRFLCLWFDVKIVSVFITNTKNKKACGCFFLVYKIVSCAVIKTPTFTRLPPQLDDHHL